LRKDGYRAKQSVSAQIHLGSRTVMKYLHSPVSQTLHQAGREL
jgi:hypothetical protein